MQKLSEIFEKLSTGELSQVAIGGAETNGVIAESNYRAMGNHVKLGLTDLYKRFGLKQGRVVVEMFPGQSEYLLHSKYAVQGKNTMEPKRWILDTVAAPFRDDIIKVMKISGDFGDEFPLNVMEDPFSIVSTSMEGIRVPVLVTDPQPMKTPQQYMTNNLMVEYQANHPNFIPRLGFFDPELVNIELPDTHVQALLYFVASRVHNPIGMGQEFNAGNNWAARYEAECRRLEGEGYKLDSGTGNTRAKRGGWV